MNCNTIIQTNDKCLLNDPINLKSYLKAIKKNYQNNKELVLIIGSSNDKRFDNMNGFTLTDVLYKDEIFRERDDINMLPLRYDILKNDFFKDFKDFKFNQIIFDYNVIYFLNNSIKFSSVKYFWNNLINILNIGGEFFIPINFKPYEELWIYEKSKLNNNIKLNEKDKSFIVDNVNLTNIISLSKNNYKIMIHQNRYKDETPYLTYLNNIKNNLSHNLKSKIDRKEIKLDFYIDERFIDYYKSNTVIDKIPKYDINDRSFTYEPYPIEPRIIEEYIGDIKEYAKITRLK